MTGGGDGVASWAGVRAGPAGADPRCNGAFAARDLQVELAAAGQHRLGAVAIPAIGPPVRLVARRAWHLRPRHQQL